jgi:hypothetical protein
MNVRNELITVVDWYSETLTKHINSSSVTETDSELLITGKVAVLRSLLVNAFADDDPRYRILASKFISASARDEKLRVINDIKLYVSALLKN